MARKSGEISVFLSLILVCILSLFLGLLESARTTGARLYLEMASDSAMASVLSQYNRNLWDMYHLLFLEAESDGAVEESFASYLGFYLNQENLYPMKIKEVNVADKANMMDEGGWRLEQEILSYMNYCFPEVVADLPGLAAEVESQLEDFEAAEAVFDEGLPDISETVTEAEAEIDAGIEIDFEKIDILEQLKEFLQGDVLDLVLGGGVEISKNSVNLRGIPSDSISAKIRYDAITGGDAKAGNILDQYLIHEYCLLNFDSFRERCERTLASGNQVLHYEQEYLLWGNDSDRDNLKETVEKLLTIRGAMNLLFLLQSPEHQAEVEGFTLAISGGFAPLQVVLSALIFSLWAFGEAVWDVKLLMQGDSVAFWKTSMEWKLNMEELMNFQFLEQPQSTNRDGNDYKDYMRILFFLTDRAERNYRMMDVIQWNVQTVQENFLIEDCIASVNIRVAVTERHLFFGKNEYVRSAEAVGAY